MAYKQLMLAATNIPCGDDDDDCNTSHALPPVILPPPPFSQEKKSGHDIAMKLKIILVVLGSSFIIGCLLIIIKIIYSRFISRRRAENQMNSDPNEIEDEENQSPIHHVWYITTVGLEESLINSISVCNYKKGEGMIEGTECSVCLSEFQDGEKVRVLPKCSHAFHLPCIDTWLRSHVNCPLCRTLVAPMSTENSPPEPNLRSSRSSSDDSDENQLRNLESGVGGAEHDRQADGSESDSNCRQRDVGVVKEMLSVLTTSGIRVSSDLSDERRSCELSNELRESNMNSVRRSISMDSVPPSLMNMTWANRQSVIDIEGGSSSVVDTNFKGNRKPNPRVKKANLNRNLSLSKIVGNFSSKGASPLQPVPMKRSFSAGGKFLLPRNSRSRN